MGLNPREIRPRLGISGNCDARHSPGVHLSAKMEGQQQVPRLGLKSGDGNFVRGCGAEIGRRYCMGWIDNRFEKNFLVTTVDYVFNWARKSAIWPMTFGLACCAIEMIAASTSRFDIARFGSEVFRPSPRQSDLMIVAGTVTLKMAPVVKRIWDQMPDPKWCISMGACSSVGGPFNTYAVLQGVDRIVPVDVYVVGCPPRPENLFYGLLRLQDKIDKMSIAKKPTEVRLREDMVDDFKQQIRIAQANFANPEQLVQPVENGVVAGR